MVQVDTKSPTAKITSTPSGTTFRSGTQVQFSGSTSTANNCSGYISEYRWYIEGSYTYNSTKNHTFTLPANVHEQTYTVTLRVKNSANLYNTKTITVTVKRPQRVYHLKDHLGTVRTSVDVDGNVLGYDDYYPFGLTMPGRSSNGASNPNDNYKFTGHERDDEAGLNILHMGARGMDPVLGRTLQIDPHYFNYPGLSPYSYGANNPLLFIDPDGRDITISYNCTTNDDGKEKCSSYTFNGSNADAGRELNNTFVNQFLDAYDYASSNGGSEFLVEAATNSDLDVGLIQFNETNTTNVDNSRHDRGMVIWAPLGGMASDNGTVLSPATVLEHEMNHAVRYLTDPSYTIGQEEGPAMAAENVAAIANREVLPGQRARNQYSGGHTVVTFGPTSNQVNRQATYQYYRWLIQNTPRNYDPLLKRYRGN